MKKRLIQVLSLLIVLSLINCGGGGGSRKGGGTKKFTSRSGWQPNEQKGWFYSPNKGKKENAWEGMVFVEGGTFTMGLVKDDVMHDWNNTPTRMQVRSFFIGETETTNYEYREYVTWLKYVFAPGNKNFTDIYYGALPDTLVWKNELSRNEIFTEEYFRHPQFDYYPVVGVSWLQATRYCEWLSDRANEKALMDKGIVNKDYYGDESQNVGANHFNTEKYKYNDESLQGIVDQEKIVKASGIKNENARVQAVNRNATNSGLVPKFRLPTEAEWEYAGLAMAGHRVYNEYLEKEPIIDQLRGTKGKDKGMLQENFKYGSGNYSGIGGWPDDGASIPADVKQYVSNDFGLYGMYGNVAEWVQDVYRPIIDDEGNDFNYYRGNVYERKVQNGQGQFEKIDEAATMYDTLRDGRLIYKGLPGQYSKEVVEDARNYRDGDYQSSLSVGDGRSNDSLDNFDYYNSPERNFIVSDDGRIILQKDSKNRTTPISDDLRVVKGGSWKDPAYWLDPGNRRYKHQADAASWIGFRVAQDHMGKETSSQRTKRGIVTQPPRN